MIKLKLKLEERADVVAYSCQLVVLQHGEPRQITATIYWDDQAGIEPGWAYSFSGVSRGGPLEGPGEKPISKLAGPKRLTKALKAALAWEGLGAGEGENG